MLLISLITSLLLAPTSGAETEYRASVEWLTSESSLIFIGVPLERSVMTTTSGHRLARERYRLDEILKGPLSQGDAVTVYTQLVGGVPAEWDRDRRARLWFCKVGQDFVSEVEGKYTGAVSGPWQSSFPVGAPPTSVQTGRALDGYFTPELHPITFYREVEGRARRHVAWEDHVQRSQGQLDTVQIMREPRYCGVEGEDGAVLVATLQDGVVEGVRWPLFRSRDGEPLLRWTEERDREPARVEFQGEQLEFAPMKTGQRAFSNRRYVWTSVPAKLTGWQCSINKGGEAAPFEARVTVSGHVYVAVAAPHTRQLKAAGWTPAALEGDLDHHYNDHGWTTMVVYSKYFTAGANVVYPAAGWTGSVALIPPAWL